MTTTTRRAIPHPLTALTGSAGGGKTFTALEASQSPLVDKTFYIPFEERIPDDYLDYFEFEIVEHDGSTRGVLGAIDRINFENADEPTLLILDSGTPYWGLLSDEVQDRAGARPRRGGNDKNDLWVDAKREWAALMERLRAHYGPVIITARADYERDGHVEAHKSLLYDADLVIEIPERGEYIIRKVDSAHYQHAGRIATNELKLADVWADMGVTRDAPRRQFRSARPSVVSSTEDLSGRNWDQELLDARGDVPLLQALGVDARRANAAADVRKAIRTALDEALATVKPAPKPAGKTAAA